MIRKPRRELVSNIHVNRLLDKMMVMFKIKSVSEDVSRMSCGHDHLHWPEPAARCSTVGVGMIWVIRSNSSLQSPAWKDRSNDVNYRPGRTYEVDYRRDEMTEIYATYSPGFVMLYLTLPFYLDLKELYVKSTQSFEQVRLTFSPK